MIEPLAEPAGVPVALSRNGDRPDGHLSYRQAREAPCLSCISSPCCTNVLVSEFDLVNLLDIDHATYLLNFEGIIIGLSRDQNVNVYFHQSCGYLDVPSGLCTVHSTPLQPPVCVHYNAHTCSYRHRFATGDDPDRPLVDRHRMAWYAERVIFDDKRVVIGVPDWDEVLEAFRSMPMHRVPAPPPEPDPVIEEWRAIVLSKKAAVGEDPPVRRWADPQVSDPCTGCGAWCCKRLVFPRGKPTEAGQLEFLRYCLGFPGIEVGVAADSWAVIVHTNCLHLEGNRCSVFGTDERPLRCSYYDALSCSYRAHFGVPRPDEIVRFSRDQFPVLADSIAFDDLGRVVAIPSVELLRTRLEEAERARVPVTVSHHDAE